MCWSSGRRERRRWVVAATLLSAGVGGAARGGLMATREEGARWRLRMLFAVPGMGALGPVGREKQHPW